MSVIEFRFNLLKIIPSQVFFKKFTQETSLLKSTQGMSAFEITVYRN